MAEDGGDVKATRALHVHEEAVGALNETLKLVLLLLVSGVGVEKIFLDLFKYHHYRQSQILRRIAEKFSHNVARVGAP